MLIRSVGLVLVLSCLIVSPVYSQHVVFIHHSVGSGWLGGGLYDGLVAKTYIDGVHDITYGTAMSPDAGRPASLGTVPGDSTDMRHWVLWFNDYLQAAHTHECTSGFNQIIMFKSCFPNSDIYEDGTEPGDPFGDQTLANYRAIYRHPSGAGQTYTYDGNTYHALGDVFAAHPDILFIPVTAPPLDWGASSDANAHRARVFNNWLKNDWLASYNAAHPGLHNVAVFDFFDVLAASDTAPSHPNRLRGEYGGDSGDSHPNAAGNLAATEVFATNAPNFLDLAWAAFNAQACSYSINPTSRDHGAGAETGTIQVTTDAACPWSAQANEAWISILSGGSGVGSGTVTYSIQPNESGQPRTGTITVAGRTFEIRQGAGGAPNQSPLADAGPDQTIYAGDSVTLQGTGSDPDDDSLTFLWSQLSGPEVELTDAEALTASFVAPMVPAPTQLIFQLRVRDDRGAQATDWCAVTVTPVSLNSLVFPAFFKGIDPQYLSSFVGVAVSNLNSCDNRITVSGVSEQGEQVCEETLEPSLPAQGQRPFLTAEALDPSAGARTIRIGGNHAPVHGFFMIGQNPPTRLDGVGTELKASRILYFPLARRGAARDTTLYAYNPNESEISATFKWIDQTGATRAQTSVSIAPGGCVMKTLAQLFPEGPAELDGYVRASSDEKLIGCLVHATTETFISLPADVSGSAERLLAPHFYIPAEGGGTELRLLNVGTTQITARIRAFVDGPVLFGDVTRQIEPGAMLVADLAQLLGKSAGAGQLLSGYLDIGLSAKPMGGMPRPAYALGAIVFRGNQERFAAALPLMAEGSTDTLFPHLAQSPALHVFTGLAVFNAGTASADVRVTAFNTEGKQTGQREFSLAPGIRALDVLNGPAFFGGAFSQNGGYLRISSDHPVVCFALFGDLELAYMAAIGGQNLAVQ